MLRVAWHGYGCFYLIYRPENCLGTWDPNYFLQPCSVIFHWQTMFWRKHSRSKLCPCFVSLTICYNTKNSKKIYNTYLSIHYNFLNMSHWWFAKFGSVSKHTILKFELCWKNVGLMGSASEGEVVAMTVDLLLQANTTLPSVTKGYMLTICFLRPFQFQHAFYHIYVYVYVFIHSHFWWAYIDRFLFVKHALSQQKIITMVHAM